MELQEAAHESSDDHSGNRSRVVKKVKIKVGNPTSGLGSMLEVLYQLEALGAKPTTIHAKFSRQEFQAAMDVETRVSNAHAVFSIYPNDFVLLNTSDRSCVIRRMQVKMEKAEQNSLRDTEKELPSHTTSIPVSFVLESWQQNEQV